MPYVMQVNSTLFNINFIEHSVITHTKLKFRAARQSLVIEAFQARAHLIHLALYHFTHCEW